MKEPDMPKMPEESEATAPIGGSMPTMTGENPTSPESENPTEDKSEGANGELIEIINRFSPGSDTSTPEGLLAGATSVLKKMVPAYDKLYDIALTDEESAGFIKDFLDTGDAIEALVGNYDPEEIQAILDESENGDHEAAKKKWSDKVSAKKQMVETLQKNKDISMNDIAEFEEEKKDWSPEKAEGFEDFVTEIIDNGMKGLITKKTLAILEKGYVYDEKVSEAEENGKVIGRNQNIVTQKANKAKTDELLPEANGGMETPTKKPGKSPILQPRTEFRV